jgi:hypothetical protein
MRDRRGVVHRPILTPILNRTLPDGLVAADDRQS